MMFASKTPRDLNRDPLPWWHDHDELCDVSRLSGGHLPRSATKETEDDIFDPRPEFDHVQHNQPNPLLADYRLDIAHTGWRDRDPRDWLKEVTTRYPGITIPWRPAEMDHALRVLTRLAKATR